MPFPEFDDGGLKILFFSRGRGRGHAIPDIEIVRHLQQLDPTAQVRLVSYATGGETFQAHSIPYIDLGLPERNTINETIIAAAKLTGWLNPDLVVAHEEFMALPAAKIFDKPTIFLTDWFSENEKYAMASLRLADTILFLDESGIYPEPESARGKVTYIGPVLREFNYSIADRPRARRELNIPSDAFTIAVLPGSWAEEAFPIAGLVIGAFDLLPRQPKHLIWAAGADEALLKHLTAARPNITVLGYDPAIDRIMTAADAAITKGTRKTLFELQSLGIPSVSLPNPTLAVDRLRSRHFPGNIPLDTGISADLLVTHLLDSFSRPATPIHWRSSARNCADMILKWKEGSNDDWPSTPDL